MLSMLSKDTRLSVVSGADPRTALCLTQTHEDECTKYKHADAHTHSQTKETNKHLSTEFFNYFQIEGHYKIRGLDVNPAVWTLSQT